MTLAVQAGEKIRHRGTSAVWPDREISSRNYAAFQRWAQKEILGNTTRLSIDLNRVDYVNAAGLAAIIRISRFADNRGIDIIWLNTGPNVAKVLALTRLDKVLNVRQDY